jgi:hypothetical protein
MIDMQAVIASIHKWVCARCTFPALALEHRVEVIRRQAVLALPIKSSHVRRVTVCVGCFAMARLAARLMALNDLSALTAPIGVELT